jgi:hypothetical protein
VFNQSARVEDYRALTRHHMRLRKLEGKWDVIVYLNPSVTEELEEDAQGVVAKTAEGVQEAYDKAAEAAGETYYEAKEGAKEAWQDTKEGAKEAWEATKETTKEAWQDTKEGAKEAWQETKEGSKEAWEATKETSEEAWQDTKEGAQVAADAAQEVGRDVANTTDEAVDSAAGALGYSNVDELPEGVERQVRLADENVKSVAEDAAEEAQDAAEDAREAADDAAEEAQDAAEDAADDDEGLLAETRDDFNNWVDDASDVAVESWEDVRAGARETRKDISEWFAGDDPYESEADFEGLSARSKQFRRDADRAARQAAREALATLEQTILTADEAVKKASGRRGNANAAARQARQIGQRARFQAEDAIAAAQRSADQWVYQTNDDTGEARRQARRAVRLFAAETNERAAEAMRVAREAAREIGSEARAAQIAQSRVATERQSVRENAVWRGEAQFEMIMDGRYLCQTFQTETPFGPFNGLGFVGYNAGKDEYESIWMDNQGTGMMIAAGAWDRGKKVYAEEAEIYDPVSGENAQVKNEIQFINDDRMVMRMSVKLPDTDWRESFKIVYTRSR